MIPQFEPFIQKNYIEAVSSQLRSGWIGFGKTTENFEKLVAEKCGCDFALATTSGTTALMLALMALGVDQTTTVFFPSYTFLAGANAARLLGANVQLVDIKEKTLCMDPYLFRLEAERLAPRERAVAIFVDHNGYNGSDRYTVRDICDMYHIPMIEDAAQCIGMLPDLVGDYGIMSFSTPKLVSTGQGGAVLSNSSSADKVVRDLSDHGGDWRKYKIHQRIGVNFKFNDILASYGIPQLEKLTDLLFLRQLMLETYELNGVKVLSNPLADRNDAWMAIHPTKNAARLVSDLKDANIQAVQYYRPIHHNPPYVSDQEFAVAEEVYNTHVYLPSSLNLSISDIAYIASVVKDSENDLE